MKKTLILCIATIVTVGSIIMSCSKEDNIQPEKNVVTLKASISFSGDTKTKALTGGGVKTFAAGDQIAVIYKNTSDETVKAVSEEIATGVGTSSATFTVTLTNPNKNAAIRYIYPAAMAKATVEIDANLDNAGTVDFTRLNSQDGTLDKLGSDLDLCTFDAVNWGGDNLPTGDLTNQLAVCALTLKNSSSVITSDLTQVTIKAGAQTYNVAPTSGTFGQDVIYVAIRPVTAALEYSATDGTKNYTKTATSRTYAAGNFYNLGLKMFGALSGLFTINKDDKQVKFAQGNLQATYNGTSWSWAFAEHQWDYIGNNPGNTSITGNGTVGANNVTVDLFGWVGASSSWTGAAMYGISNKTDLGTVDGYGNVKQEELKSDWGNTIGSGWYTLTSAEWNYLLHLDAATPWNKDKGRMSGSTVNGTPNACYTYATINTDGTSVNGLIIFPDGVTIASDEASTWGTINGKSAYATKCTSTKWTALAAKGCVFLPAAGRRNGISVEGPNSYGYYMQSAHDQSNFSDYANYVVFASNYALSASSYNSRCLGGAVRLVRNVTP
ncbi:MAG: hypothetical protein IKS79_03720 [Bacteroidales bacterium]|nr:hypothetical protein [Bacteroidales bacterium]